METKESFKTLRPIKVDIHISNGYIFSYSDFEFLSMNDRFDPDGTATLNLEGAFKVRQYLKPEKEEA